MSEPIKEEGLRAHGLAPEGPLKVSLLTPEKILHEGHADTVVVPAHNGEVGIRNHHAPLVARLGAGVARITLAGKTTRFFVSGGFVQVADNVVTILSDQANVPTELDRRHAHEHLSDLLTQPAVGDDELEAKRYQLELARARLRVANAEAK